MKPTQTIATLIKRVVENEDVETLKLLTKYVSRNYKVKISGKETRLNSLYKEFLLPEDIG